MLVFRIREEQLPFTINNIVECYVYFKGCYWISDSMHHVLGARLKVAIKYDERHFWVREMLLHICQVTSDNIPVGSSFLPRNGVEEQTSI